MQLADDGNLTPRGETEMNATRSMRWAVFAAAVVLGLTRPVWAGNASDNSDVTFAVGNSISITEATGNFTLTFTDTVNGSVSSGETVIYTVKANNMPNAALTGAVSAKVSALVDGISLKAFPGDYTNSGTSGNAILSKVAAEMVIGATAVNIYNKDAGSGNQDKVLNGTIPIHYRGVATRDLADTDGGTTTLTVTLKDA